MPKVRIYARSFFANWVGTVANMVVWFFLSPFVVRTLGVPAYGVWSLLMTVTGYLGLVEIGVRVSTGRFVNYYIGRGNQEKVDSVVNTSLVFYTAIGVLVLAVAGGLGAIFRVVFPKTPPAYAGDALWVLALMAGNVWLGFISNTFAQLLRAHNRFDLRNVAVVFALLVRAGGTVLVLKLGHGLVGLAAVQVAASLGCCILLFVFSKWKGAPARYGLRHASRETFREVFGFGVWAFVDNLGVRVIFYTDVTVIGLLIGMKEIAYYSIALMLVDTARNLFADVLRVITPDMEKAAGRNDLAEMRWFVAKGTRVTTALATPIVAGLMVLGHAFIRLWMPPGFGSSGWVLLILMIAQYFGLFSWAPLMAIKALGEVRFVAVIRIIEAALNLGLSLFFVLALGWGIYGVALGTLVPMVCVGSLIGGGYGFKRIRLSFKTVVLSIVAPSLVGLALFGGMCLAAVRFWRLDSWLSFFAVVGGLAVLYVPIMLFVVLSAGERKTIVRVLSAARSEPEGIGPS